MKKELKIFDIDETLFETTAKIRVVKDGEVLRALTNQEFNDYELKSGEDFDFSEFKNAEKFNAESKPITKVFKLAKDLIEKGEAVTIITARANFDNKEVFLDTFRKYGLDIDKVYIYRVGNTPNTISPAKKKATLVKQLLQKHKYNKVSLFDDSVSNLKEFLNLKQDYATVEFEAMLAKDGKVELFA